MQEISAKMPGREIFSFLNQDSSIKRGMPFSPAGDFLWVYLISNHASAQIVNVRNGRSGISDVVKHFKNYPKIGVWLDRCWPKDKPPKTLPALYRTRLLNALAILIADLIQSVLLQPRSGQNATQARRMIQAVQDHVWETGGKDASLDRLAEIAGYSKYHFFRLFKQTTGQSVHTFVNLARITKYHELAKTHTAKKHIADALGFSCPAAFSRWLRHMARSRP